MVVLAVVVLAQVVRPGRIQGVLQWVLTGTTVATAVVEMLVAVAVLVNPDTLEGTYLVTVAME
jgi:hypothetical protein